LKSCHAHQPVCGAASIAAGAGVKPVPLPVATDTKPFEHTNNDVVLPPGIGIGVVRATDASESSLRTNAVAAADGGT
jgi:hypothetical protein